MFTDDPGLTTTSETASLENQLRWRIWYHHLFCYRRTEPGSPLQESTFLKPQCINVMVKIDF